MWGARASRARTHGPGGTQLTITDADRTREMTCACKTHARTDAHARTRANRGTQPRACGKSQEAQEHVRGTGGVNGRRRGRGSEKGTLPTARQAAGSTDAQHHLLVGVAGVSREVVAEGGLGFGRPFARDAAHGHSRLCEHLRHTCPRRETVVKTAVASGARESPCPRVARRPCVHRNDTTLRRCK